MSPLTLERAIRAFCREAGIDRRSVHNITVAGRTMLWVAHEPLDPLPSDPPHARQRRIWGHTHERA